MDEDLTGYKRLQKAADNGNESAKELLEGMKELHKQFYDDDPKKYQEFIENGDKVPYKDLDVRIDGPVKPVIKWVSLREI